MAAPVGTGGLNISGDPNLNVGSVMKCTEAPTWSGGTEPYVFQYLWKYRPEGGDSSDWVLVGNWATIASATAANIPTLNITTSGQEFQLGIRCTEDGGENATRYSSPTGPSTPAPLPAGQYVATDVENNPVSPQPPDVEVTDAFGNIFDNFNQYGTGTREVRFYTIENTLRNPQPAYQNGNYVQRGVDNSAVSPAFEPDAAQWIARGVDNAVRTPQPYEKSPFYPGVASTSSTLTVTLRVAESEGLIVTEDDVSGIRLEVIHTQYPSIANFD
jgi:hypothetical protein